MINIIYFSSSPGGQKEVQAPCLSPRLEEIEPIPDSFYTEEVVLEEGLHAIFISTVVIELVKNFLVFRNKFVIIKSS